MIKFYCDKCGKEITDNVNTVAEETELVDCHDVVIMKLRSGISHICDECRYEDLTCGFKVGDNVVTSDGRTGVITSICNCDRCKKRGFYEPTAKMDDGNIEYIMISDKDDGFKSYYKIGDKVFGNLDEEPVNKEIKECQKKLMQLYDQRYRIEKLKQLKEKNKGN